MSAPQLKGVNYLARPIATYCDWLKKNGPKQLSIFGVDQPKANLARLLFPEIEEAGFACLPESFVDGVHADMDRCTRNFLAGPPLRFLRYWQTLSDDPFQCPKLALVFPEGYWPSHSTQLECHAIKREIRHKCGLTLCQDASNLQNIVGKALEF